MRRQIPYILAIIFLNSCSNSDNWNKFPSHGLPQKDEVYNDLIFVDSLTGFLGGDRMISLGEVNNQYQFTNRTVLYKTRDQGKSWSKIPLNYKGSVSRIFAFKDTLVVLLQDVTSDSVYILKSKNYGENWERLLATTKDIYIREVQFTNAENGFIVTDDRSKSFLLQFQLNKWDTLLNLPNNHYHFKIIQDNIFSLIPEQASANSIGVLITNIKTGKTKELFFDKPYFIASLTSYEKYLYLAASYKNIGAIIKVTKDEIDVTDLGNYSDYQPDQVYFHDKTIMTIANREKDVAFLGVIHNLLISKDNGKTWALEEIPDPMYLKPATMYKDKFFMTYCGTGYIQIRK